MQILHLIGKIKKYLLISLSIIITLQFKCLENTQVNAVHAITPHNNH